MRKTVNLFVLILLLASFVPGQEPPIPTDITNQVKATNYPDVRIKKFPIAVECWTYRRYSFFETVDKVKALGISLLQAYPGQPLGNGDSKAVFDEAMPEAVMKAAQAKLREAGVSVVAYGVVDIGTTEASIRKVFDFARKMGIRTVVCEPQDEAYPLLDKLVKEYDIRVAIHNHALPNKYALPQTVLDHIKALDERIGACADTGHWMRSGLKPIECLRLLQGRIIDTHLKDLSAFGKGPSVFDVAWGSGRANIRDILAELTLQDYAGYLTMEYENEKEVATPEPAIRTSLEFVKKVTYFEGYSQRRRGAEGEDQGLLFGGLYRAPEPRQPVACLLP